MGPRALTLAVDGVGATVDFPAVLLELVGLPPAAVGSAFLAGPTTFPVKPKGFFFSFELLFSFSPSPDVRGTRVAGATSTALALPFSAAEKALVFLLATESGWWNTL